MGALFDEAAFAEDEDLVGVLHGGETMRDDESSATGAELEDGLLNGMLGL